MAIAIASRNHGPKLRPGALMEKIGKGLGCEAKASRRKLKGLGCKLKGPCCKLYGYGCRLKGLGCKLKALGCKLERLGCKPPRILCWSSEPDAGLGNRMPIWGLRCLSGVSLMLVSKSDASAEESDASAGNLMPGI